MRKFVTFFHRHRASQFSVVQDNKAKTFEVWRWCPDTNTVALLETLSYAYTDRSVPNLREEVQIQAVQQARKHMEAEREARRAKTDEKQPTNLIDETAERLGVRPRRRAEAGSPR
jgi:hypothetical protein